MFAFDQDFPKLIPSRAAVEIASRAAYTRVWPLFQRTTTGGISHRPAATDPTRPRSRE